MVLQFSVIRGVAPLGAEIISVLVRRDFDARRLLNSVQFNIWIAPEYADHESLNGQGRMKFETEHYPTPDCLVEISRHRLARRFSIRWLTAKAEKRGLGEFEASPSDRIGGPSMTNLRSPIGPHLQQWLC